MAYIKKVIKKDIEDLDKYLKETGMPKYWNNFVETEKDYLIIRTKNDYKCNCCNHVFQGKKKINDYEKCPKCKRISLVKSNKLKHFDSRKNLFVVIPFDKYPAQIIIRVFELFSYLYNGKMRFIITEYLRVKTDKLCRYQDSYIANMMSNMGYRYVNHWSADTKWIPAQYQYNLKGKYYYHNLNKIFNYRYYDLKDLAKHTAIDIKNIAYGAYHQDRRLELLIKSKLYNLANDYFELKDKGSFNTVFELDRSYLHFIKKHNLSYSQLETLRIFKIKNIMIINYLNKVSYYFHCLEPYMKIKPYELYKYNLKPEMYRIYEDYLRFAKELGYDLKDKKILYPKKLKEKHDEYMNLVAINKDETTRKKISKRRKKLSKNTYKNSKYIIYPADSIEALKDESMQQNNCVKTYAEDYAIGKTDLYFMRLTESKSKSLVTVEVRNNKIIQKRIKNNGRTTINQDKFLKYWENTILNKIKNKR